MNRMARIVLDPNRTYAGTRTAVQLYSCAGHNDTPFVKLQVNGAFLNPIAFSFAYTNPTTHAIGGVGITNELSNRISYYVCTFDDVSYVVCCVVVATDRKSVV